MSERFRVLSIDGGGTRGLIPSMVLEKIEHETGRPIYELFDLIAGTSVGGLIALGLTAPAEGAGGEREQRNTAHETSGLLEGLAPRIFHSSRAHLLRAAGGLVANKYHPAGLEEVVKEALGETGMMSDALADVMVGSYAIEKRRPIFFKSYKARKDPSFDLPMWLVARAATSAPTFFPPTKIEVGDQGDYLAVVDAGVFLNNPAVSAYAEARKLRPDDEIFVLSLGTGQMTHQIRYGEAKEWGLANWARPLLDMTFDGVNQAIDYQLRQLLGRDHYIRMQPLLGEEHAHLDSAGPEHQRKLRLVAERHLELHKDTIARISEIVA